MDAFAQLRVQLNRIHSDLNMRGIYSQAVETATYSIETLARAYMSTTMHPEWERCELSTVLIKVAELLRARLGNVVSNEAIYACLYADRRGKALPDASICKVFVCQIRKKLRRQDSLYRIETVCGIGYRMIYSAPALALTALQELQAH